MSTPTFAEVVRCIEGECCASCPVLMCGCGDERAALFVWLRGYLMASAAGSNMADYGGYPPAVAAVLAHTMDEADLLDHGGVWYWSWPGHRGRAALSVLAGMSDQEIVSACAALTADDMDPDVGAGGPCPVCGGTA